MTTKPGYLAVHTWNWVQHIEARLHDFHRCIEFRCRLSTTLIFGIRNSVQLWIKTCREMSSCIRRACCKFAWLPRSWSAIGFALGPGDMTRSPNGEVMLRWTGLATRCRNWLNWPSRSRAWLEPGLTGLLFMNPTSEAELKPLFFFVHKN